MSQLGVSAIVAPNWAVMDDYYWDVYLPLMNSATYYNVTPGSGHFVTMNSWGQVP